MIPQAVLPLAMNALIAAMFVAGFAAIAYGNTAVRKARWFAFAYALGLIEPLTNLLIWMGVEIDFMRVVGFTAFLLGLAAMAAAISHFHGERPMWKAAAAIVLAGVAFRLLTLDAPRDAWWNLLGFQMSFAFAAGLCALAVSRHAPPTLLNRLVGLVFCLTSLHFPMKAVFAMLLGTGATEREYTTTFYAVISQTSSGVLLVGAGVLLLIMVLQSIARDSHLQARSDPLTGLPNRRALDEWFADFAKAGPQAVHRVAIIDIDHFKQFNDRFGHEMGDRVLCKVASCLKQVCPSTARLARTGGEEFVLLLPDFDERGALHACEGLRQAIGRMEIAGAMPITVSIGMTEAVRTEAMSDTLRRADRALYRAKGTGRDRCEIAPVPESPSPERAGPPTLRVVGA